LQVANDAGKYALLATLEAIMTDACERDIAAGLTRLEAISAQLDQALLAEAATFDHGARAAEQPWLIAGCSDGIGLQTVIAAIDAGVLKHGLGIYWEPPHFLELRDDGTPVSPVHYARYQNALALGRYAERAGARLDVVAADVIMAPRRGLKGDVKEPAGPFNPAIVEAFEPVRAAAPRPDAVVVNSVAFGKWICPREGHDAITVPSVDFDGQLVQTSTKSFHARGYEETLDTMGRNHGLMLEAVRNLGWLGPDSLTAFFTWAGGSQNIDVLEGIYGKGALGDAKVIAEADTAAFRLTHGLSYGAHAIVRLPAFLSAALMGIPGGGLFGLISRRYLEDRGCFDDMPTLASRMIRRMFGPEWARENPISQIELDMQECLHIEGIKAAVDEAYRRIAEHRAGLPEDARDAPIPVAKARKLLAGLAPENFPALLARFRPELDGSNAHEAVAGGDTATEEAAAAAVQGADEPEVALTAEESEVVSETGHLRPDMPLVTTLRRLGEFVDADKLARLTVIGEDLIVHGRLEGVELQTEFRVKNGGDTLSVFRVMRDAAGNEVAEGTLTLAGTPRLAADADPGSPIGYAMPVREPLEALYGAGEGEFQRAALLSFAADQLRSDGLLDDAGDLRLSARFGERVAVGDTLRTFARRAADAWVVTVLNAASAPVLRLELKR
jgi:hypothetical protein